MLTVQYPPAAITVNPPIVNLPLLEFPSGFSQTRAFIVNEQGYITSEVSIPPGKPHRQDVITTYLPPSFLRPRWDGEWWVDESAMDLPPIQVRGFSINDKGFIVSEVLLGKDSAYPNVVTAYLPRQFKKPRWDGERWVETQFLPIPPPIENQPLKASTGQRQVRGFIVNEHGYIACEVSLPWDEPHPGVITTYLPSFMRRPRWDGERWVEMAGLLGWVKRLFS